MYIFYYNSFDTYIHVTYIWWRSSYPLFLGAVTSIYPHTATQYHPQSKQRIYPMLNSWYLWKMLYSYLGGGVKPTGIKLTQNSREWSNSVKSVSQGTRPVIAIYIVTSLMTSNYIYHADDITPKIQFSLVSQRPGSVNMGSMYIS